MTRPAAKPEATRGRPPGPVRPSSTDPVDAWLDVLVSMLGLPPDQRRTVRDELEDHLRSRIDDLLIAGRSEGEALRQAVAELGETADLARQITHAHDNPRKRRIVMHALVLALVGTVTAIGVLISGPNQPPNAGSAKPPLAAGAAPSTDDAPRTVSFDIQDEPFVDAFRAIANAFGRHPSLDANRINRYGRMDATATIQGEYTLDEAVKQLLSFDPHGMEDSVYSIENDRIVITDAATMVRASVEVRTYPLGWIEDERDRASVVDAIYRIGSVTPQGQLMSAQITVGNLVVAAPPWGQQQVQNLLAWLRAEHEIQSAAREEALRAERQAVLERIRIEYETVSENLMLKLTEIEHTETAQSATALSIFKEGETKEQREETRADLAVFRTTLRRLQFDATELRKRLDYLRERMFEMEYAFVDRNAASSRVDVDFVPAAGIFTVEGAVGRAGDFEIPAAGITLSQALTAAAGLQRGAVTVQLHREGEPDRNFALRDIYGENRSNPEIHLKHGDRIVVQRNTTEQTSELPADEATSGG